MCTQLYESDKQCINLPYSDFRSCDESDRNDKEFPANQVEVKGRCKLNFTLVSNASQNNRIKTLLLMCVITFLAISILCQHTNRKV